MTEIEWMNIFGDNLKDILNEYNMTQKELAEASNLNEATISRYIKKQRMPTMKAIINIAYALDCDVGELIDFDESINWIGVIYTRNKISWKMILTDFKNRHPKLSKQITYWCPHDYLTILIYLKDGMKLTYDYYKHEAKIFHPSQQ